MVDQVGEWAVGVTGVVRWFDPDRRLGLLSRDTGGDLLVHGSALPPGMLLVKGARVKFTVDDHPRGPRAAAVTVLELPAPRTRKTPHEMVTLLEDLIGSWTAPRRATATIAAPHPPRRPPSPRCCAPSPTTSTADPDS